MMQTKEFMDIYVEAKVFLKKRADCVKTFVEWANGAAKEVDIDISATGRMWHFAEEEGQEKLKPKPVEDSDEEAGEWQVQVAASSGYMRRAKEEAEVWRDRVRGTAPCKFGQFLHQWPASLRISS